MRKSLLCLFLVLAMVLGLGASAQAVTLTMGSWRADDVEQVTALLEHYKEQTGVEILFQPTIADQYNATLSLQLESGIGPDLMYARSYDTGRSLYAAGYFGDCTDIPGLMENFTASSLEPWQNADGSMFAVPFAAVSHAVYYNVDLFNELGLAIPTTFEQFLEVCEKVKAAGYVPLANGIADNWDILECLFLGMLPNYVGGAAERVKYEAGEKKLNDENFVRAYTDFQLLAPYLSESFTAVTYNDSAALFATERAAMFMDGSWTAGTYDDVEFEWSVFAMPAREGDTTRICFHPDMAITYNKAGEHVEECRAFLAWLCTPEGAAVAASYLPVGYYPMINAPIELTDPHANAFLALNEGRETDARFIWPNFMTEPNLYTPMVEGLNALLRGETTPQALADSIAALAG